MSEPTDFAVKAMAYYEKKKGKDDPEWTFMNAALRDDLLARAQAGEFDKPAKAAKPEPDKDAD